LEHLSEGLTFLSFAGVVKCNKDSLYEWEKKHPEFSAAKKVGTMISYLYWDKLNKNLCSGKNMEGVVPSIFIFNMKNRFQWRDKPIADDIDFKNLSLSELKAIVARALQYIKDIEEGNIGEDNKLSRETGR
jgi:hypothetical protein